MVCKFCFVLICAVALKLCSCQRRITHGRFSEGGRQYMVYLLNSKYSENQPKGWLCGGALISDNQILTSAACLTEVKFMYAIAGYKKYVSGANIDSDKCTRERKQKIVEIIIPKAYKKDSPNPEEWMKYDVGVAVVEKPYDFSDLSYHEDCSYPPNKIFPHYGRGFEIPNTVASIFGWGGTRARRPGENQDLNSEYLQEAKTVITNTSFCARYVSEELKPVVYSSLICAFGSGYSNEPDTVFESCLWRRFDLNDPDKSQCADEFDEKREKLRAKLKTDERGKRIFDTNSDAGGICENDHGGPLISYFGSSEVIIGLALTSIYTSHYECEGPFLYFGLGKMGSLLQCLLARSNETRSLCIQLSNEAKKISINWPQDESTTKEQEEVSKTQILREGAPKSTQKQISNRISKWTPKQKFKRTTKRPLKQMLRQNVLKMRVTVGHRELASHLRNRPMKT